MRCIKNKALYKGCTARVCDVKFNNGKMILELPETQCNVFNGDTVDFAICRCFDDPMCPMDVYLKINGKKIQLFKVGAVKSDQLQPRKRYHAIIGTEGPSATLLTCVPKSRYGYPVIPVVTFDPCEERR